MPNQGKLELRENHPSIELVNETVEKFSYVNSVNDQKNANYTISPKPRRQLPDISKIAALKNTK